MKKVDTNIWVHETKFKLFGADFGNRMTIIHVSGGRLLIHSPVKIDSQLVNSIKELGEVSYIVTPNNFHGLFVEEWVSEFPDAIHYTAKSPSVEDSKEVSIQLLKDKLSENEIEVVKVEGAPKVNEYAFIHKGSNTLILTDMAFNIGSDISFWSKVFFKLNGAFNCFGPTRLMRSMISNPEELKSSIKKILSFDIERVIVSHGGILEVDAKETLKKAFSQCYSSRAKKSSGKLSLSRCG